MKQYSREGDVNVTAGGRGVLMWVAVAIALVWLPGEICAADRAIRVLVWDEQQPAQKKAYDNFLGNAIADHLKKAPGLLVKSANMNEAEQGLSDKALEECDVLIWWGHVRHREIKWEVGDKITARIKAGKLSLIALHSAHWCTPFVKAMNERAVQDALASLPAGERESAKVETVAPKALSAPKRDAKLTPSFEKKTSADGKVTLVVQLPLCVFPAWRADGKPGRITTLMKDHPIAKGLPEKWDVTATEMYDEPFHVPAPDAVIFGETWDAGEKFRSGCLWAIGRGKVFYFRPGHETYGVYKEALPLKVIENAALFLGSEIIKGEGK